MADIIGTTIRSIAKYPGRILAKTKITPNQLTLFGFLVNCAVAYLIAKGNMSYLILGIFIWIAGFFDALDGSVARENGQTTTFGKFFDSMIDRYSDAVIYLGILIHYLKLGEVNYIVLVVVAMIGSLAVSYARAKSESLEQDCEIGLMTRAVRIIILGASFCINQIFLGLLIIAVLSHFTVLQRIAHVYKQLNK